MYGDCGADVLKRAIQALISISRALFYLEKDETALCLLTTFFLLFLISCPRKTPLIVKIIAMEAENQRLLSVHKRMVKSPNNRTKNNANLILPFMYLRTFKFNNQEIDTLKEDANKYHFQTINIKHTFTQNSDNL